MAVLYVVALEDQVFAPTGSLPGGGSSFVREPKVQYLGLPTPWRPDEREWWWVAPGDAVDRPGYDDYTRFHDSADAAAWALRLQAWFEDMVLVDPGGASAWRMKKVYVREIS